MYARTPRAESGVNWTALERLMQVRAGCDRVLAHLQASGMDKGGELWQGRRDSVSALMALLYGRMKAPLWLLSEMDGPLERSPADYTALAADLALQVGLLEKDKARFDSVSPCTEIELSR